MVTKKKLFLSVLIILSLVLLITIFYFWETFITALMTYVGATKLEASISENPDVNLSVHRDKDEYCPEEAVNITNNLTNIGNCNVTGDLNTIIRPESGGSNIYSRTWDNAQLEFRESKIYSTEYTVEDTVDADNYVAESNYTYDGEVASLTSDTFKIKKGIGEFYRSPNSIEKTLAPSSFDETEKIFVWLVDACENANVTINVSGGDEMFGPGKWATFNGDRPYSLILAPDVVEEVKVNISIPSYVDEGTYSGTIYEYAEDEDGNVQIKSTSLTVHVTGLVLRINVTVESEQVCPGESISAIVGISTNHPDYLDVNLTYRILDPDDNVIDQSTENITMYGDNQTNPSFTLPSNATLGYYTFMSIIEHNSTRGSATDLFEVIPCVTTTVPVTEEVTGPGGPGVPAVAPTYPVYNITLNLSTDILHAMIGEKTNFVATVDNVGTGEVELIKISTEGIPLTWITSSPYMSDLSPGKKQDYLVTITIPNNAEPGVYELKVKATDDVESNIKTLKLIIGRDLKEVADLLLLEVEKIRMNANESLLVEECLDITIIKSFFNDAEIAYEKALEEYTNENYEESVNWLEYAIPIYEKVLNTVDITLELEIKASEKSLLTISNLPSIFELEKELELAKTYLNEKNYKEICIPILRMRRSVMMSLIFWPGIIILIIVLVIVAFIVYRKIRKKERIPTLEEIEKRLKSLEELK